MGGSGEVGGGREVLEHSQGGREEKRTKLRIRERERGEGVGRRDAGWDRVKGRERE